MVTWRRKAEDLQNEDSQAAEGRTFFYALPMLLPSGNAKLSEEFFNFEYFFYVINFFLIPNGGEYYDVRYHSQ